MEVREQEDEETEHAPSLALFTSKSLKHREKEQAEGKKIVRMSTASQIWIWTSLMCRDNINMLSFLL